VAAFIVGGEQYQVRQSLTEQTIAQGNAIADAVEATAGYYVLFGLTDDLKKIISDLKAKNASIDYVDLSPRTTSHSLPAPPRRQ